MKQRWIAKWRQEGKLMTYIFESTENRMIAGIDFRLALADMREPIPTAYYLEEENARYVQEEYHPST